MIRWYPHFRKPPFVDHVLGRIGFPFLSSSSFIHASVTYMNDPKTTLVGGIPTPLKNISSSVGMMNFPAEWKVIKFHSSKPPTRTRFAETHLPTG